MAPSLDSMVVEPKQFDRQSFKTLFGLGQGGGGKLILLSISLYLIFYKQKLVVLAKQFDTQLAKSTILSSDGASFSF